MQPRAYLLPPALLTLLFVAPLWLLAGCANSNYCEGHPNNDCRIDKEPQGECQSSADCTETGKGVCAIDGMTQQLACVQCTATEASACGGTSPLCGDDLQCRGCKGHAECGSNACVSTGACAAESDVAYVSSQGTNNDSCSKAQPCNKISEALKKGRSYVKITGALTENLSISSGKVTLLADTESSLTAAAPGAVIEIKGLSQVEIFDLEISGIGGNGPGILLQKDGNQEPSLHLTRTKVHKNVGIGIQASDSSLRISQSTIHGNFAGGISIERGRFEIANSFIIKNGSPESGIGGLQINNINTSGNKLEFTTIAQNSGNEGITTGVACNGNTQPLNLSNNIVYGNTTAGTTLAQVNGPRCMTWRFSNIGPVAHLGEGNINVDPAFVNAAGNDFHLMQASPARDVADPNATQSKDIDNQDRTDRRDMGADEVM